MTETRMAKPEQQGEERAAVARKEQVVVLGAGMHPWGKWGRNFVEYGVVAARAALADAGVAWTDVEFVVGRRHHAQRLPRLRRRRHLRPGARLDRGPRGVVVRRVRRRAPAHRQPRAPGSWPGCATSPSSSAPTPRPRASSRPIARRAARRPRLAAVPAARRHQPDVLRALRPPPHGPLRRHRRGLRRGQGEERPPRAGQPQRPLPQGGHRRRRARPRRWSPTRCACSTSAPPPTAAPRSCSRSMEYARTHGARQSPVRVARGLHRHADATRNTVIEMPNFATDSAARGDRARAHVPRLDRAPRPTRRPGSGPTTSSVAEVYDLSTALELDWYENIGLCKPGEAEELLRRRRHHDRRPHPGEPERRARLLRRGHPRAGDRPGVRAHLAAAGPGRRPPGRGRQASASPSTRASSATAPR